MLDAPNRLHQALRIVLLLATCATFPLAVPAARAEPVSLLGRVTDEAGTPIEGATVLVRAARSNHQLAVDELAGSTPAVVADATSDVRGAYRLDVDPGAYELVVTAEGKAARRVELLPVAESFHLKPVALPEASTFRLRVLDAEGRPAPRVRVAAQADNGTGDETEWHALLHRLRSDDNGEVEMTLGVGRKLDVRLVAEDGSFYYQDGLRGGSAEVELERGTEWVLRVEDPRGRALPGVIAHLSQAKIPVGMTDDNGEIRVRLASRPQVTLRLSHDDGYYLRTGVADDPSAETKRHVFTLDDPQIVSGRVVDSDSGDGIAGALVWPAGLTSQVVFTDRSGGFQLTPLPGFEWFQAAAAGYGESFVDLRQSEGSAAEAVIQLTPVTRLTGTVIDSTGRAVAGAEIEAVARLTRDQLWPRRSRWGLQESGTSLDDGTFVIRRLHPEVTYEVIARRAGFAPARERVATVRPPEVAEVELTLEPGIRAVGRIVDEADLPIAGALVEILPPPPEPSAVSFGLPEPDIVSGTSGEDGNFEVPDLGLGTYRIEVRRSGFSPTKVPGVEIAEDQVLQTVSDTGETRLEADLGVIVLVPGVDLEGVVVDTTGRPVEGAELLATPLADRMSYFGPRRQDTLLQQTTNAEGQFRFVDLVAEAPVQLDIKHPVHADLRMSGVQPPTEKPLRIVMSRSATLRGRVVDESLAPVPGLTVQVQYVSTDGGNFGSRSGWGRTDERGAFEISGVTPTTLTVDVGDDTWQVDEPPRLELEPGQVVEGIEIRAARSRQITGTVSTPVGRPAPGCEVVLAWNHVQTKSQGYTSVRTEQDGSFRFGRVVPGESTVTAVHPDFGEVKETVQVTETGAHVDLVLGNAADLTGTVLTPDGEPAVGAVVSLHIAKDLTHGGWSPSSRTVPVDADGGFRLPGVAEGTYLLAADHPKYAQQRTEPFDVTASSAPEQIIRLGRGIVIHGELLGLEFEQLSGVRISAYSTLGLSRQGVVRHDATYRIDAMSPGSWTLQAVAGQDSRTGQVELVEGETEATFDFDFGSGLELEGRVRLDDVPVSEAHVMLIDLEEPAQVQSTQTNFEGKFNLGGLKPGRNMVQIFSPQGFRHHQTIELPYPGPLDIHVRTSNVEGRVYSEDGTPLAGALISATVSAQAPEGENGLDNLISATADGHHATTDAAGVYHLDRIPEGVWNVTARHDGFAQAETTLETVQGADLLGVDFSLRPVSGLWLDLQAAPGLALPPALQVAVLDPSGNLHSLVQVATGQGAAHLSSLPEGTWRLIVAGEGIASVYLTAKAPEERPVVPLMPEARLEIVLPEAGSSPIFLQAVVTRSDGFVHQPIFDGHLLPAWFLLPNQRQIRGLSQGTWTVESTLPDGTVLRGTATVQAGDVVTLELLP